MPAPLLPRMPPPYQRRVKRPLPHRKWTGHRVHGRRTWARATPSGRTHEAMPQEKAGIPPQRSDPLAHLLGSVVLVERSIASQERAPLSPIQRSRAPAHIPLLSAASCMNIAQHSPRFGGGFLLRNLLFLQRLAFVGQGGVIRLDRSEQYLRLAEARREAAGAFPPSSFRQHFLYSADRYEALARATDELSCCPPIMTDGAV